MCYDISFTSKLEDIEDYLPSVKVDVEVKTNFEPVEHVQAQSHSLYPVILREDGILKCKLMEWGIVTPFMKTPEDVAKMRNTYCNARAERIVDDKKSYWHSIRHQRCLIPVTGIFEHRKIKGWKKNIPYLIRLKHRNIFALPGLYNYSTIPGQGNEVKGTFTILTRAAVKNEVMKQIHNTKPDDSRMVMFLPDKMNEEHWLIPDMSDNQIKEVFSYELPPEQLDYHSVFTIRSGSQRPDNKNIIDEYKWPGMPPLGEDVQKALF